MISLIRKSRLSYLLPMARIECLQALERILQVLGLAGAGIEIMLVDDAEMASLNKEFLGLQGPTNVLSFPFEGDGEGLPEQDGPALGSIALSLETLDREALLYGQDPAGHFYRLASHAVLHLAGFPHGPEMDALTLEAVDAATRS